MANRSIRDGMRPAGGPLLQRPAPLPMQPQAPMAGAPSAVTAPGMFAPRPAPLPQPAPTLAAAPTPGPVAPRGGLNPVSLPTPTPFAAPAPAPAPAPMPMPGATGPGTVSPGVPRMAIGAPPAGGMRR